MLVYSHLSHVYGQGSSIYTTYLFRCADSYEGTYQRWQKLKAAGAEQIVAVGGTIIGALIGGRIARKATEAEIASRERVVFHPDRYAAYLPLFRKAGLILLAQVGDRIPEVSDFDDFEDLSTVVFLIGSPETAEAVACFVNSWQPIGADGQVHSTPEQREETADAFETLRDLMRADLGCKPIAPLANAPSAPSAR